MSPSQVREEAIEDLLTIRSLRGYARAYSVISHPDTDEEAIQRAGISTRLVDLFFENKARHA